MHPKPDQPSNEHSRNHAEIPKRGSAERLVSSFRALSALTLLAISGCAAPLSQAHETEGDKQEIAMKKAKDMVGKEFKCLAIGGKTAEQAARTYFQMQTGTIPERFGMRLVIVKPPEGPLRTTIAKPEWMLGLTDSGPMAIESPIEIEYVRERLTEIMEKCYDNTLKGKRAVKGKMALKFVINPDGSVNPAEFIKASDVFTDANFERAVIGQVAKLKFNRQKEPVVVAHPISWSSSLR